jgi:hypothetical protein
MDSGVEFIAVDNPLALYHLASAGNPKTLPGLANIFKDAGVATLPMRSKPVVFVGTAAGANQPFTVEDAHCQKSLGSDRGQARWLESPRDHQIIGRGAHQPWLCGDDCHFAAGRTRR